MDPDAIHRARVDLRAASASARYGTLATGPTTTSRIDGRLQSRCGERRVDALCAKSRSTSSAAADRGVGEALAGAQFDQRHQHDGSAGGPRRVLTTIPGDAREKAMADFGERYRDEPLVLDKWFTLQATIPEPETLDARRSADAVIRLSR